MRLPPPFTAIWNVAVPGPDPLVPGGTVIQLTLLVAVHEQPGTVVTTPVAVPASSLNDKDVGVHVTLKVHPVLCVTATDCPATVSDPDRAGPAFAATLNATEPVPVPLAPDVTVIHESLRTAVQPQPLGAVTEIGGPLPAAAPTDAVVGVTVIAQVPAWETVTVWPATLMVPLRAAPPFAATLKVTTPEPLEVGGDTRVIQGAALVVAQLHPADAVTLIDKLLAPPAGAVTVEELSVNAQVGAAAWVIVSVAEPTVTVPIREAPVLAPTTKVTVPAPLPAEAVTAIHDALLTADHAHPVVTATDPGPPAAGIDCADGFNA